MWCSWDEITGVDSKSSRMMSSWREDAETHIGSCDVREWCSCEPRATEDQPHWETEEARKTACLVSEGAWPCQHPDSGLLASRTMVQYISVTLSRSVCGPWWWERNRLIHLWGRRSCALRNTANSRVGSWWRSKAILICQRAHTNHPPEEREEKTRGCDCSLAFKFHTEAK